MLKILGDAALEEHSQWILLHRERSIDQQEVLRLAEQWSGSIRSARDDLVEHDAPALGTHCQMRA